METSDEVFAAQDAQARLRRRRLWLLGGGLGALGLAAMAVVFFGDAPQPEISDLAFEPVKVSDEENLYLALVKLGAELEAKPVIPGNEPEDGGPLVAEYDIPPFDHFAGLDTDQAALEMRPSDRLWETLLRGESWTPERIARWKPGLEAVVAKARQVSGLSDAQGTFPGLRSFPNGGSLNGGALSEVTRHLKLAARALQADGRSAEAIEVAGMGWRFGRAIRDSRGQLADYSFGVEAMASFERVLCEIILNAGTDAGLGRKVLAILDEEVPGKDGYAASLKNEFYRERMLLLRHTAAVAAVGWPMEREPGLLERSQVFFPLLYKRNYTVALCAERLRGEIKAGEIAPRMGDGPPPGSDSGVNALFQVWNQEGRVMLGRVAPWFDYLHRVRTTGFSLHSAVRTVAALRLYHLEHGTLPERLDDLVPAYLPAVPLDYADRKPLRYSREFRAVWSVGDKNLTITAADQVVGKGEVFYRLDFAEPVAPANAKTLSSTAADEAAQPAE